MTPDVILDLILGSGGALVVLAVANVVQYRDNRALRTALDGEKAERLRDAQDGAALASAYLKLREQETSK